MPTLMAKVLLGDGVVIITFRLLLTPRSPLLLYYEWCGGAEYEWGGGVAG
jgi:hypothetical protein